ncbi:MAG: glycosyltransferase family 39 protein [bacterium]|nr:glycosyltransferase family 39 protein [bacterium]
MARNKKQQHRHKPRRTAETPRGSDAAIDRRSRAIPWLLGIILLALLIRGLAVWTVEPTGLVGDEGEYMLRGRQLAAGQPVFDEGKRPPAFWCFLGGLFSLGEPSVTVARAGNVALSVLALPFIFYLGRRFGGTRVGLWATGIAAFYPTFIAYSHYLWTESLYVLIVTAGLSVLVWHEGAPRMWKVILAGAVLGGGALTREAGLMFLPFAAGWLVWIGRQRIGWALAAGATFALTAGLVILPWTLRVNRSSDHFVLLSYTSYLNLYIGNGRPVQLEPDGPRVRPKTHYRMLGQTRSERELAARRLALAAIAERLPWWPVEKIRRDVPRLFTPNSFAVGRLLGTPGAAGWAGEWGYHFRPEVLNAPAVRVVMVVLAVGVYVCVVVPGVGGLVLTPHRRFANLFALFIGSQVLPTLITFACSRFRLGFMPLLMIATASFLAQPGLQWRSASGLRRLVALAVMIVMLLVVASNYRTILKPQWG